MKTTSRTGACIPGRPRSCLLLLACLALHASATDPFRHSNAWIEEEGIRAAWLGYKLCTEEMAGALVKANVNTVILSYGFHDLLNLESLHWDGDDLNGELRQPTLDRLLDATRNAASRGVHVFWLANYELPQMLPHLQRLGYHTARAEGPARYLRTGAHEDAAALDPVFWRGITGFHGEQVARLSLEHPIEGVLYDNEHLRRRRHHVPAEQRVRRPLVQRLCQGPQYRGADSCG